MTSRKENFMGLFNLFKLKKTKDKDYKNIIKTQDKRIKQLERLCYEKDAHFSSLMSDGLRHGSSLAGKYMNDKKQYKEKKKFF